MKEKVLISLSGGMDSATLLAWAIEHNYQPQAIGFYYGSKHNQWENASASKVADHYQIPFRLLDLSNLMQAFKSNLLLSGGDIPEGHYEQENMALTVVPCRNVIFCSVLGGIAMSEGINKILLGVHAGDRAIYPDCRHTFILAMELALRKGTDLSIELVTPFLHLKKMDIIKYGLSLDHPVPYQLTRTCYKHQALSCGKCGACQERLEGFRLNERDDPIAYEKQT